MFFFHSFHPLCNCYGAAEESSSAHEWMRADATHPRFFSLIPLSCTQPCRSAPSQCLVQQQKYRNTPSLGSFSRNDSKSLLQRASWPKSHLRVTRCPRSLSPHSSPHTGEQSTLTDCGSFAGPAPKLMVCFCSMSLSRSLCSAVCSRCLLCSGAKWLSPLKSHLDSGSPPASVSVDAIYLTVACCVHAPHVNYITFGNNSIQRIKHCASQKNKLKLPKFQRYNI